MLRSTFKRTMKIAGVSSVAMLAASCVTVATQAPTDALAVADSSVADAISADAAQLDAADLAKAQRKIARAHDAAATGDYADAHDLAEEAALDARLAATRARATKAARAAASLQASNRALDEEISRRPK